MHSAVIVKPNKKIFAILDIGTTKIACIVVRAMTNLQVLGVGYKKSAGIYSGAIINAKEAFNSVSSAIEEAEESTKETINEIYVNVAGSKILSRLASTTVTDVNSKVTMRDIKRIFNKSNENINNNEVIVHNIPVEYVLDNIKGITDPIGMYGHILQVNMHTVTIPHSVLLNLQHCVTQNQVYFKGCCLSAYSAGVACINEDEKELGVIVIDIGGGSTSIGVFNEGSLVYASSIPVGGVLITRDIASAFSIDMEDAEKMKVLKGNVILTTTDKNDIMEIEGVGEKNEKVQISSSDLIAVVRPRVEEIFEMVKKEIEGRIINRVVLTGGTSQLTSIRELASYILGCQVRLGTPLTLEGMGNYDRSPLLSAGIGLLMLVNEVIKKDESCNRKKGIFHFSHKVLEFIKGN